jgi:hypothetical protein
VTVELGLRPNPSSFAFPSRTLTPRRPSSPGPTQGPCQAPAHSSARCSSVNRNRAHFLSFIFRLSLSLAVAIFVREMIPHHHHHHHFASSISQKNHCIHNAASRVARSLKHSNKQPNKKNNHTVIGQSSAAHTKSPSTSIIITPVILPSDPTVTALVSHVILRQLACFFRSYKWSLTLVVPCMNIAAVLDQHNCKIFPIPGPVHRVRCQM